MKYLLICILTSFILNSCISDKLNDYEITADLIDPEIPPVMDFNLTTFEFDTVAIGSEVEYEFIFTNKGPGPLLINSVKAGCGCTVLKNWPKHPIQPGENGSIPVVLTTKRAGFTKKYISVLANTEPGVNKLFLQGYVVGL